VIAFGFGAVVVFEADVGLVLTFGFAGAAVLVLFDEPEVLGLLDFDPEELRALLLDRPPPPPPFAKYSICFPYLAYWPVSALI